MIARRSLLLAGVSLPAASAAFAQCVTDALTVDACLGGARLTGPSMPPGATLNLNFMTPGTLDPRVTFTRASTATYTDVNGVLQTAAVDQPRWDYDPVTHVLRGLLIEEARINALLNSAALTTQSVTVAAVTYTLSFYGTGTVTLSGVSTAGPLTGTGAFPQRVSLSFTPTAGTLTLTVTGAVQNAQLERSVSGGAVSFASSYIPTTAAAVTRQFDVPAMTGTNFSSWFNNATGSFALEMFYATAATGTTNRVMELSDGGATNFLGVIPDFVSSRMQLASTIASVAGTTLFVSPGIAAGIVAKTSIAYGTSRSMCTNVGSGAGTVNSTVGGIATVSQVNFGNRAAGDRPMSGYIRRVVFWPRVLSNTELQQAVT